MLHSPSPRASPSFSARREQERPRCLIASLVWQLPTPAESPSATVFCSTKLLERNVPVQNRNAGYVFQDLALFPHLTVGKNVEYGLSGPKEERRKKSAATLESFRIANLRDRKPKDISGGERQRVALARALVTDPCVLLLDEPMAALDAATKSKIIDDLRAWNALHNIPILYITHNREEVFALGDRVLLLKNGRIIADGTPHVVMTAPRQESMAQLVGFENIFHATVAALHEERGTMKCRIADSNVELETPLLRADTGSKLFVGIRAGDILLATVHPVGLSARNVIPGRVDFIGATGRHRDCAGELRRRPRSTPDSGRA